MRKLVTLFLLLITLCLVFAGTVAATPKLYVSVVDENGSTVNATNPGDKVNLTANSTTDKYLSDPAVLIKVIPKTKLTFKEDEAVMIYNGETYTNDLDDPFFYWDDYYQSWIWWIGWVYGDQFIGEDAQLFVPATVSDVGEITVNADYMQWNDELNEPIQVADSYTFQSGQAAAAAAAAAARGTVPMQDTGTPLALAVLGLLSIISGTLYSKLR